MNAHEANVRLAGWSVGAGLPILPAVLPTTQTTHTARPTGAATGRPLRAALTRWTVMRRART